jgi:hypothetical protein
VIGALLDAVARYPLAADGDQLGGGIGDIDLPHFLSLLREERLTGLFQLAVTDDAFPVGDAQPPRIAEAVQKMATHTLQVERRLLLHAEMLEAAGVVAVVLKGAALAHTTYASPELRPVGDLDVLVRGRDMRAAAGALEGAGVTRQNRSLGPTYDARFGKGVTFRDALGYEVDVHRSLTFGPFTPWIDADDLWSRQRTFRIAGRELRCLDSSAAFVHACLHVRLSRSRLINRRDVAELSHAADLDLDAVERMAANWKVGRAISEGVGVAHEVVPVAERIRQWAVRRAPSDDEVRLLAAHDRATGYRAKAWALARELRGTARIRFLACHLKRS